MRQFLPIALICVLTTGLAQNTVDWDSTVKITIADFRSPQSKVDNNLTTYSIVSGAAMNFNFSMSAGEFAFTKNFNSKVSTVFNRNAAVLAAEDSTMARQFVAFGQYSFDLTELYSRRCRKELYENKTTFSSVDFFQPVFEKLQADLMAEQSVVLTKTEIGKDEALLRQEHEKVLLAIAELSDYCKECKIPKKSKK